MPTFDALKVRAQADALIVSDKSKVEAARQLFLEEIMDWSDFFQENCSGRPSSKESQDVFDSITSLWIQFSNFEISLHQFKKAVEVFEKAIVDPICCKALRIYQTYAQFCIDRKKLATAQNAYIKGLCAGLSDADNSILWSEFLSLMHSVNKSTELTIADLYDAVKDQKGVEGVVAEPVELRNEPTGLSDESLVDIAAQQLVGLDSNESKEAEAMDLEPADSAAAPARDTSEVHIKMEVDDSSTTAASQSKENVQGEEPAPAAALAPQEEPQQVQAEERRYAAPDDLDDVTGMTPEQIIRTYTARPPMLFTALHKEPTASGIAALNASAALELEAFLQCKIADLPSRTPNLRQEPRNFASWTAVDKNLDLLEAMWSAQALKERHFDSWITDMRNMHIEQEASLVESFVDVDAPATSSNGNNGASVRSAEEKALLKKKQHSEVMRFRNHCAVQQELLHALINKALFALLLEQQTQLARIAFPRFSMTIVDALKSYMNSRKTASMSSAHSNHKLDFDSTLSGQIAAQQELVCAFLSTRLNTVSMERSRAAQLSKQKLTRASSIDQDSELGGDLNYFDAEAKKRRKRRRIITQHHNDSYSSSAVSSYGAYNSPGGADSPRAAQSYPYHGGQDYRHSDPYQQQYPTSHAQPHYDSRGGYPRGRAQQAPYYNTQADGGGYAHPQARYPAAQYAGGRGAGSSAGTGRGPGRGGGAFRSAPAGRGAVRDFSNAPGAVPPVVVANNPALPMLQKLASLIQQPGRK